MADWLPQSKTDASGGEFSRFVARQPILDRLRRTFGYELLFRSGWENRFTADGEAASRHMIDNAVAFGMESLVGDAVPFVNCTRDLLLKGLPTLLPKNTVLEVLEDVKVDDDLVAACKRLTSQGYQLALDDYDFSDQWKPLLECASYIKVDFRVTPQRQRLELLHKLRFSPIQFVAEKVEDEQEFRLAMDEGFHLFQGYFFTQPVVLGRPALSTVINRLRFLAELGKPGFNVNEILRLMKEEPTITYRMLRLANSAAMGAREPLSSLRTALAMIGEEQFRKMALTAMTSELCGGQTLETLRFILQKARFCELIAPKMGLEASEMYLFGMLAVMRTTLSLSDADLSQTLKLSSEMLDALQGEKNRANTVLEIFDAHSKGKWMAFSASSARLAMREDSLSNLCQQAQRWAADVMALA